MLLRAGTFTSPGSLLRMPPGSCGRPRAASRVWQPRMPRTDHVARQRAYLVYAATVTGQELVFALGEAKSQRNLDTFASELKNWRTARADPTIL